MRLERADFRHKKADLRPERADLRPQRADLRPRMAPGGGTQNGETEKQNCPMWNHRSSAPLGPLPKKRQRQREREREREGGCLDS